MTPFAVSRLAAFSFTVSALAAAALALPASARTFDSSAGQITVERIAGPFEHPWAVEFLPDGRQLVTERPGRISLVENGSIREVRGAPEVFDNGQGGLLDIAVAPDFAETGEIYLSFAEPRDGRRAATALARATLSLAGRPQLRGLETIWRQEPALGGGRHFGSRIVFAQDGTLFVTTGDRGSAENAQDLDKTQGKVIRLNRDGSVPADNPFVGQGDARPEIWSYGHRNLQGADLDPETGLLWTVEHGAQGGDEINQPEPGLNYGWPEISYGRHYSGGKIGRGTSAPGMEQPRHYWDPSIAPSGLVVYDGAMFAAWQGDILVGALKDRLISRLERENGALTGREERLFTDGFGRIRDVAVGPDGAIWFVTDEPEGGLFRASLAR